LQWIKDSFRVVLVIKTTTTQTHKHMNKRTAQRYTHLVNSLSMLGFTMDETDRLLKISRTLQRWHELECGTGNEHGTSFHVERDPVTDRPFLVTSWRDRTNRRAYQDREKGALRRLAEILKGREVTHYQQTDPRGCALYLLRPNDVPTGGSPCAYYTRGIAVCID
jgi:hypothetical protein